MNDIDERLISGERVCYTTRKHWLSPLVDSLWAILMIIGSLVLAWLQPSSTSGVLGFTARVIELVRLGLFLTGAGWIISNIIAWRTAVYYVTNRRILGHEGLLRGRSTDTLLSSIADVRTVVPGIGRMLGYGHIRIISAAGEAGGNTIKALREPETFKREILERKTGAAALAEQTGRAVAGAAADMIPTRWTAADAVETLAQLAKLRDTGAIRPEEFEAKKKDLLDRI